MTERVAAALTSRFNVNETVKTSRLRIRLRGDVLQRDLGGSGPLISEAYVVELPNRCDEAVDVTRLGGTFMVGRLSWVPKGGTDDVADFQLDFEPGSVDSSFRVKDICATPNTTSDPLPQNHTLAWTPLAQTLYPLGEGGYRVDSFSVTTGPRLGHRELSSELTMGNVTLTTADSFDLFHAPGLN